MTVRDIEEMFSNGLTPIEIHAWEDGSESEKVYWSGTLDELWNSGYMNYDVADVYIDQLTCGLVISIPQVELDGEEAGYYGEVWR